MKKITTKETAALKNLVDLYDQLERVKENKNHFHEVIQGNKSTWIVMYVVKENGEEYYPLENDEYLKVELFHPFNVNIVDIETAYLENAIAEAVASKCLR